MSNNTSPHSFHTVHLVVDMQNMYMDGLSPQDRNLPSLVETFIQETHKDIPPFYLAVEHDEMFTNPKPYELAIKKTPHPDLTVHGSSMMKTLSSGFRYASYGSWASSRDHASVLPTSSLHGRLKQLGAESLILSGVNLSICVLQTAMDAADLGYDVTIMTDLCRNGGSQKDPAQEIALIADRCEAKNIKLGHSNDFKNGVNISCAAAHKVAELRL